jgi:tetratricopeptide (TPR) repeat protein
MAWRRRFAAARCRLAAALLAAFIASPSLGGIASAQDTGDAAYRGAIDDAVQEFSAGHWEEARALFKRAHELSPNARTLRGMGMAAYEMRLYVQAIRELEAALRDTRKPLDAALRANVQQLIVKAREFVGRVRPEVQPAEAKLLIDGREPVFEPDGGVLLDVGTHVFSATLDGYKPTNVRAAVEGASDQVVRVLLEPLLAADPSVPAITPGQPKEPAAQPEPQRATLAPSAQRAPSTLDTYAWIALAGAGAFGATAGVLYFAVGEAQYSDLESDCAPRCSDSQISDSGIKTTDALTNVFLGLAIASGLTSGVLFAIHAGHEEEHDSLALDVGPGAAAVRGRF